MKNITIFIFLLSTVFLSSCETLMIDKIDEFNLESGGYMRTVTPYPVGTTTFSVSRSDMPGTRMEAVLEAVTPDKGAKFASYELVVRFVATGNIVVKPDVALKTIPASSYAPDPASGYPRYTLTVTGQEIQSALALTAEDLGQGAWFEIRGTMVLTDGRRFNMTNTGANITGGAFFSSPFYYRINLRD